MSISRSRRKFLKAGTVASLSVLVSFTVPQVLFAQLNNDQLQIDESQFDAISGLTRSTFSEALDWNSTFQIKYGSWDVIDLELIEVSNLKNPGSRKRIEKSDTSFSLLFKGPTGSPLGQDNYMTDHPNIGTFPMFLVPIGEDSEGRYYEAVFNRRVQ